MVWDKKIKFEESESEDEKWYRTPQPPGPPHAPHIPPPPPEPPPAHHMPPPPPPPPPLRDMLTPLAAKALILRIIKDKPSHGYEISETISKIIGGKISKSRVYGYLNSLEIQGLVLSKWEIVGGKARKIYYITDAGEAFLEEAKAKLQRLKNVLDYIFS